MVKSFFNNNSESILGAIGGIGSFFGNQIGSALSSSRSWKNTKRQMYLQDELNRAYTRDSYSLMRDGLKKAGYNPLLALGSSAQQALYSGSAPATDSDAGDQAVNSAMAMQNFRYQNDLLKKQSKGQELTNKHQELENQKLEADVRTDPKKLLTEYVDTGELPKDVKKVISNVKKSSSEILGKLPYIPSSGSVVSSASASNQKAKITNLVQSASQGSKRSQFVVGAMLSNPATRGVLISYLGYKTVKYLMSKFSSKPQTGHDKGFDFEYIKDKDLK